LVWLSETQYGILTVVAQEPDLNISRIADRLGVSPPTVTRAVGTLEGKGLVSRVRRSSHARDITVKLTPTGEETRSVLEERRHRQIVALLAQMDDEGVQRVVDAYETMVNAVQTLSRRDGPGD
jgi:DNA-binding MarR family transcriptional regulator